MTQAMTRIERSRERAQVRATRRTVLLLVLLTIGGILLAMWTSERDARAVDRPDTPLTVCTTVPYIGCTPRTSPPEVTTHGSNVDAPAEDEPGWNCLTMGNHSCGTDSWWPLLPEEIAQLGDGHAWDTCLTDSWVIVCPDGWVQDNDTVITEDDAPYDEPWQNTTVV